MNYHQFRSLNKKKLISYSSGYQKYKIGQQGFVPSGDCKGESVPLPFTALSGCPNSLACGPASL